MKVCIKCKQEQELDHFYKNKNKKDGLGVWCKDCFKKYLSNNPYYQKNKDKVKQYYQDNKDRIKQYYQDNNNKVKIKNKIYQQNNKEKFNSSSKKYYQKNKEKVKQYQKIYRKNNKIKINNRSYKRYKNDKQFKLSILLRCRFIDALKSQKITKRHSALNLLGCSIEQCKQHLESQFKPEMNWDNHGKIWEIDHIKPCFSFNLIDIEQQKQCFHYTNLQPLFKTTEIAESFGYNEIGNRNKNIN
jgi:hypothetical protein